jgi:hypothetical protein
MNTTTKLSTAIVLGLSLLGMSAADAASARLVTKAALVQTGAGSYTSGKVIHLGTIVVTPADTGAKAPAHKGTVDLGVVKVTAADTLEARAARKRTVYLGSIDVTPVNSAARYAVAGTVDLGVISVKAKGHRVPVIGSLVAAIDSTHSRSMLAAVGALVFARAGG